MSMAPRCLECDSLYGRPHDPECSFAPRMITVSAAQYLAQMRRAAEGGNKLVELAKEMGFTVIGDEILCY